jgi:hypothetical protein
MNHRNLRALARKLAVYHDDICAARMREHHITDPQERLALLIMRDEFRREMKAKAGGTSHRGLSTDLHEVPKGAKPLAISSPDLNNMTVDRRLLAKAGIVVGRKYTAAQLDDLLDRTRLSVEERIAAKSLVEASGCLLREGSEFTEAVPVDKVQRQTKKAVKRLVKDEDDENDGESSESAKRLGRHLRRVILKSRRK